jgi:hypothetical protein
MRIISFVGLIAAAVALVSASGAATGAPTGATIDLSSKAKVHQYLRSIHVNPKGVVIQRGLRNYAGAHCPGKGWTCARTRHTVVQIAKPGGVNRFVCGTAKCTVVQFGGTSRGLRLDAASPPQAKPPPPPPNYALCVKTTGITQSCVINQPNATGQNKAVVWMVTPKLTGLTQSSSYSALITQGPASATGSSNNNLACVRQFVWIDGSTTKTNASSTTVTNDNHQSVTIRQNSLTGSNTVEGAKPSGSTYDCDDTQPLTQDERLTSVVTSKGSITQKQNTATGYTDPLTGDSVANVVVRIDQNQGNGFLGFAIGVNTANFDQTSNQVAIANTPNGTVNQQQNANVPNPPYSGMVGTINQDSSKQSTAVVNQTEMQCEDAVNQTLPTPPPGNPPTCPVANDQGVPSGVTLTQTQYGPEGVFTPSAKGTGRVPFFRKGYGESKQTGAGTGVVDSFTLTQIAHQFADQTSGQHQLIQGDCKSSGNSSPSGGSCQATQTATLNGQDTQDGYTAGTISQLIINCTSGHSSCTATPPPVPTITSHPTDPSEDTDPAFEWSEAATAGVSFDCSIDSGDPAPCDSGDTFPVGLGDHTFEVTASDNFGNTSDPASFSWTVVPYLTFDVDPDGTGASAGWQGDPGSPIELTVGSPSETTYAQITLHNFEGIAVSGLGEPTFTTGTYSGGSPRYEVDFSDGNYAFGFPSQAGYGSASWELVQCTPSCGSAGFMTWGGIQAAEAGTTVTAALIEADGGVPDGTTFVITGFTFDGYSLSDFAGHFH